MAENVMEQAHLLLCTGALPVHTRSLGWVAWTSSVHPYTQAPRMHDILARGP